MPSIRYSIFLVNVCCINLVNKKLKFIFAKKIMTKKKVLWQENKTTIDETTGEIITSEKTEITFADREPDFIKLYVSDISRMNGLPPSTDKVLLEIIGQMGYSNIFAAYAPMKRFFCKKLGISMETLNKSVDQLYKKGILVRIERGMYLVDPNLFARGKWEDIKKLRLVIEYDTESGQRRLSSDAPEQLKKQLQLF